MKKIQEIFNFDNIGGKIKGLAKWSCWITILIILIAALLAFFVLLLEHWTAPFCWVPIVCAPVAALVVWIGSWAMYAFGEFVEDTHAMRENKAPTAQPVTWEKKTTPPTRTPNGAVSAIIKKGEKVCPLCGLTQRISRTACWSCGQEFDN